jgi:DNA repair protein RecN (Recombination protein N)
MLERIHVKNLALIEETEVAFGRGQNILTGETGAGKSLLLGCVNLALGAKFEKDMQKRGTDYALVELTFHSKEKKVKDLLDRLVLLTNEDDTIVISRRVSSNKNVYRLNGEIVTGKHIKEITELLLDIHGQHDHQSLLYTKKHLEILDSFCGDSIKEPLQRTASFYQECKTLKRKIEEESMDKTALERRKSMAEYETQEIETAPPCANRQ